ncbi:MAG: hypothetical protein ACP5OP_03780 [Leptospirillia bacterium]
MFSPGVLRTATREISTPRTAPDLHFNRETKASSNNHSRKRETLLPVDHHRVPSRALGPVEG